MKRALPTILLAVGAIGFALGLWHLLQLRFESGDIYPPYSSLRSDPLGTMALYESLELLPGVTVRRDFSTDNQLPSGQGTTYLHLAATPRFWNRIEEDVFKEVEAFLFNGGRLVVTFFPETSRWTRHRLTDEEADQAGPTEEKVDKSKKAKPGAKPAKPVPKTNPKRKRFGQEDEDPFAHWIDLKERWGIEFGFVNLAPGEGDSYAPVAVTNRSALELPETVMWHSGVVLSNLAPSWRVVYARGKDPVLAERTFGRGSVVFAADSFFLSNEALHDERHTALLAWLVGPGRHVVFDEAHLGIAERPGIAALVQKYHLHGFVVALLALAGLFLWQNTFSLAPPYAAETAADFVTGRESAAGFVSLLRRSIPTRDVLAVCVTEWKRSCGRGVAAAKLEQVQAVLDAENALPPRECDPVAAHGRLRGILSRHSQRLRQSP
jgi:hypothetical protein